MTTFPQVLSRLLARDAGRPLVTFYDDATGERIELSVTTYANWVAKTASLLVDEHDLERGSRLLVDLPTHWLGPVFLGAAWTAGSGGLGRRRPTPWCAGPTGVERWAAEADGSRCWPARCCRSAVGSPSRAGRRARRRRRGLVAAGRVRRLGRPGGRRPGACAGAHPAELWSAAAAGSLLTDGGRLLSEANPASPPDSPPSPSRWHAAARWSWSPTPRRSGSRDRAAERATARFDHRSAGQVVASHPLAEEQRRAEARGRARQQRRAGRCPSGARPGPGARSGVDVADPDHPVVRRQVDRRASSAREAAGPVARVERQLAALADRLSGAPSAFQRPTPIWRAGG